MTTFHVLAAIGDFADELRSLGLHEAPSADAALARCLAELDQDPVADHEAAAHNPELADLLRRDQQQLRDALAEPAASFVVTPVAAEAHFVRDHDGVVRAAAGPDAAGVRSGRGVAGRAGLLNCTTYRRTPATRLLTWCAIDVESALERGRGPEPKPADH